MNVKLIVQAQFETVLADDASASRYIVFPDYFLSASGVNLNNNESTPIAPNIVLEEPFE
jgi:hypothetical protein